MKSIIENQRTPRPTKDRSDARPSDHRLIEPQAGCGRARGPGGGLWRAGTLRRFAADESGSITLMMILFFLMILMATGFALDLAKHEVRRASLQSAVDRGALAAASLTQTLEADSAGSTGPLEGMVQDYVTASNVFDGPVSLTVDETIEVNSRNVSVYANTSVGTMFMAMAGLPQLAVGVETRAIESLDDLEISMVFDTSGSMDNDAQTGDQDLAKLNNFKIAAGRFVNHFLADNDDDRVSISMVQYDSHVNPGPWMFNRVTGGLPTAGQGSCYEIKIQEDLVDNPGTIPGLGSTPGERRQIVDARSVQLESEQPRNAVEPTVWTGGTYEDLCPPDDVGGTIYLEDDRQPLFDVLGVQLVDDEITLTGGGIEADGSTTTYFGTQWGLALLNPATQPIISEMAVPVVGLVDPAMADRPAPWLTNNTQKVLLLLSDGGLNVQLDFYSPPGATSPTGVPTREEVETAFSAMCLWAKDPTRDITVITVSYDMTPEAEQLIADCASPGFAFRANTDNIAVVFDQIANSIQRLRLRL